jgi:hypothetical protein
MRSLSSSGAYAALALALALAACGDGTWPSPTPGAELRTDSTAIALAPPSAPPHPIQVFIKNTGTVGLRVRMCSSGGYPAADLRLQEQQGGVWAEVLWVTCANPGDGYDLTIPPRTEERVSRLNPAPHQGIFRYRLVVGTADGGTFATTSNSFEVHAAP